MPPVSARSRPSRVDGYSPRQDPCDQAQLRRLPARRLHEDESLAVIEQLDRENIDLLEISGGTYESPAMSDGGTSESTRRREAFFLDFADRVRAVTTVPLLVTGGFRTGTGMTDAITSGATDLIGI